MAGERREMPPIGGGDPRHAQRPGEDDNCRVDEAQGLVRELFVDLVEKGLLAFALRGPDKVSPTLDILVQPVVPFDEAYDRRVERTLEGAVVSLASIEDIIRLKTGTGRQRDAADIAALRQILRMERASYDA